MQLIIAEKPSVGRNIAAIIGANKKNNGYFEGNGYLVSWCIGHLVGLVEAPKYDGRYSKWQRDDLPIIPKTWKYSVFDNKKMQFNILKKLMNQSDVESIICATDAGREGELIFRLVYDEAQCNKPFFRLWISSMEESAIKKGFENLQDGNKFDPLYESALCRAKADWLIGINATRLYSTIHGKTLNVGRVQSPTLAMVVDRQQKIQGFIKEKYYMVRLKFDGIEAISGQLNSQEKAEQIKNACQNKQAKCVSLITERKTTAPPKLFDLTSLQRESNRLFELTAKQTLDSAQKLYEQKLITYPRTDSRFLTSDMEDTVTKLTPIVREFLSLETATPENVPQVINDKKVTDHHAIIPTAEIAKVKIDSLDENTQKVLLLISSRLISALADRHEYDSTTAVFECEGQTFTTTGKTIYKDGFKALDPHFRKLLNLSEKKANTADAAEMLPQINEGQVFDKIAVSVTDHLTKPPVPFTEDTLLSAMERAGVDETDKNAERKGLGT
ncbi:MAG: DNA topoisomerase, partial [Oscillospiraceae bacterium]|nr:DNA topoisomerase [Oscillospiraceae bacterium]